MNMDLLASIGVAILLVAFFANLVGWMSSKSKPYLLLNAVGAGMAAYASWAIDFMPFVVLEGTWCVVSLLTLGNVFFSTVNETG
ncbi:MAG: hypothetical protein ABJ275_06020 [Maricaulaceae bacterium]